MLRAGSVCCCLLTAAAWGDEPCAVPRVRDLAPLEAAASADLALARAFAAAANACAQRSSECEKARSECAGVVSATVEKQAGFDEGLWLRDMLLPYQGQTFPMGRPLKESSAATGASCNVEISALEKGATERTEQANRREALAQDYQQYVAWVEERASACRSRAAQERANAALAKAEADRLAAETAAVAAREMEAKRAAQRERDAKEKKEREAAEAVRRQTEAQAVADRERKLAAQERAKRQMVLEAESALERAKEAEAAKKKAALAAVKESPAVGQAVVAEAALAERAREEAQEQLARVRREAQEMEVDDSFRRSRGSVAVAGAMGAIHTWSTTADAATSVALGPAVFAHVGFWGTAPMNDLASGLEVGVAAGFLQHLDQRESALEGLLTGRWYFGRFGVGAVASLRLFDQLRAQAFWVGATAAAALIDTPHVRVLAALQYLPVGTSIDFSRVQLKCEASYEYVTVQAGGALGSQQFGEDARLGWSVSLAVGARLSW